VDTVVDTHVPEHHAEDCRKLNCSILQSVYDYWTKKRGVRFAPARSDIEPEEIRALLAHVMLIDVIGRSPRFRYRYRLVGTAFAVEYGQEITGKFVDEIDLSDRKEFIFADYDGVVRTRAPSFSRWEFTKSDGRHMLCRRVLLPLSSDGDAVNMLFGALTASGFA
jgi:hypothetical protein